MKQNKPAQDLKQGEVLVIDNSTKGKIISAPLLEGKEVVFEVRTPQGVIVHRVKNNTIVSVIQKSNRGGLRNPPGGRPKKPEGAMVSTSIRLPKELIEWLSDNTENRNEWIIEAIKDRRNQTK